MLGGLWVEQPNLFVLGVRDIQQWEAPKMVLQFLKQNTSGPRLLSLLRTSDQSDLVIVTFTSEI